MNGNNWYKERNYIHFDNTIQKEKLEKLINSSEYVKQHAFLPLIHYILKTPKYNNPSINSINYKHRDIMYPSNIDAHIYSYYANILNEKYEIFLRNEDIQNSPIAYRKIDGKCNIHFAKDIFDFIDNNPNVIILVADVSDYFGSINHKILKLRWKHILGENYLPNDHYAVFKSITNYAYVNRDKVFNVLGISNKRKLKWNGRICSIRKFRDIVRNDHGLIHINNKNHGIPQGTPISAVLSNIYMTRFDLLMTKQTAIKGAYYRRYSDDIILICKYEHFNELRKKLHSLLLEHKLSINVDKETISVAYCNDNGTKIVPPIQYLGFTYDGRKKLVRSSTLFKYDHRRKKAVHIAFNAAKKNLSKKIYKKKIYSKYSHLKNISSNRKSNHSRKNFYSYIRNSSRIMKSNSIKRQMRRHWPVLQKMIIDYENKL